MTLDPRIAEALRRTREEAMKSGSMLPAEVLQRCYRSFQDKFGPDVLASLDGEELLETMHLHGNKDSLVYWLEFKDDEDLPASFGSIAGGSALKFGVYRNSESGEWRIGSPQKQQTISLKEAITIAQRHRDQLLRGCELLGKMPEDADDAVYGQLQTGLKRDAPDLVDLAWSHKYFHMIHPDRLDDYHSTIYQRFYLIKLLQEPPEGCGEPWGTGRYLAGGRFIDVARELGWMVNQLTGALGRYFGNPYRYWRIGTKIAGIDSIWADMRDGRFIAIGWDKLPDLSSLEHNQASKDWLREQIAKDDDAPPHIISKKANQVFKFVVDMSHGDLVTAMDGNHVLGIGRVTSDYYYESSYFPHRRPVDWLWTGDGKLPTSEGLRTTLHRMTNHADNFVTIEKWLMDERDGVGPDPDSGPDPVKPHPLSGIPAGIEKILARKNQVILYGPPGTGKTYWAELTARELAARQNLRSSWKSATDEQKHLIQGDLQSGYVRMCAFHPNYGYEDFIEGYRPVERDGQLAFELRDGIFKRLCDHASKHREGHYYLIIDEINRGDIPRIFGELLTLLEADKRGKTLLLPLSGQPFQVPPNLYIIGTMNTADRSIALLDTALRRRFGFMELLPEPETLEDRVLEGVPLRGWLRELNKRIVEHLGQEGRNLRIGHAYLMPQGKTVGSFDQFARILREEIIPLIEEYCYEDFSLLEKILGEKLIDRSRMRIREELFSDLKNNELTSAILAPSPDLAASSTVVESEPSEGGEPDEADEGEDVGEEQHALT